MLSYLFGAKIRRKILFLSHFVSFFLPLHSLSLLLTSMESRTLLSHASAPTPEPARRWWQRRPRRVLLVGRGEALERIHQSLLQAPRPCEFVGFFDTLQDLFNFLPTHDDIDDIYAALPTEDASQVDFLSKYSDTHGIRFFYVPPYQIFGGYQQSLCLNGTALLTHQREPLTLFPNAPLKRTFDFLVSTLVLLLTFPLTFLYAFISVKRRDAAQAVLITHSLSSLEGKVFRAYSFNLPHHSHLALLPRFLNVWKGDMSLVGPAAYPVHLTQHYEQALSQFMVHHFGRPGLTGAAQKAGLCLPNPTPSDLAQRLNADIDYIENWTFLRDLRILLSRSHRS